MKGWRFLVTLFSILVLLSLVSSCTINGKEGEGGEVADQAQLENARQLFDSAVSLYKQGEFEQAKAQFSQVREMPVDIGDRMRSNVDKYLSAIEDKLQARAEEEQVLAAKARAEEAAEILDQAENLFKAEKYSEAKPLYIKVDQMNADLGWRGNRTLQKRLASIDDFIAAKAADEKAAAEAAAAKRKEEQLRQTLTAAFEQGEKLYQAGDYPAAKSQFEKVQASEVSLGRSIDRKVASYMKEIAEREAKAEKLAELDAAYISADRLFKAGDFQGAIELFRKIEKSRDADDKLRTAARDYRRQAEAKLDEAERRDKLIARLDEVEKLIAAGKYEKALDVADEIGAAGIALGPAGDARLNDLRATATAELRRRDMQLQQERLAEELAKKQEAERLAAERAKTEEARQLYDKADSLYSKGDYRAAKEAYLELDAKSDYLSSRQNGTVAKRLSTIDGLIADKLAEEKAIAEREAAEREAAAAREKAMASFELGEKLYKAGSYAEAKAQLQAVADSGVDLGRSVNRKVASYLDDIADRDHQRLAMEQAEKEEAAKREAERRETEEMEQTYAQARQLYSSDRLEEARALFEKIRTSGVSLGTKTDARVASYIQEIDAELAARKAEEEKRATVAATYRAATGLLEQRKYQDALALFREVADSGVQMTRDERAQLEQHIARAEQGVAELQAAREAQMEAKAVQDRLAAVESLIEDGKPIEARAELDALVASGLPLTLDDERAIGELSQRIVRELEPAQREMVAAKAPRVRGKADVQRRYNALWDALIQDEEIRRQEREFRAEALLGEALNLIDQQQFAAALDMLNEATALNPDLEEAQQKKQMVEEILAIPAAYRPMSVEIRMKEQVRRQEARIEVENALAGARDLYAKKEYDQAVTMLRRTLQLISVLPAGVDMPKEQSEAESLLAKTIAERDAAAKALEEQKRIDAQRQAEQYAKERIERERQVVQEMLKTARAYFDEREYGKAETLSRIVLEKDPGNPTARALFEVATEAMLSLEESELSREAYYAKEALRVRAREREIPLVDDVLKYPTIEEWLKMDERMPPTVFEEPGLGSIEPFDRYRTYAPDTRVKQRPGTYQTAVDTRTIEELLSLPVSLEVVRPEVTFVGEEFGVWTSVQEVLDDIALQTGLNIFLPRTLDYVGTPLADTAAPVFYLVDVPAGVVLDLLLDPFGFGYQIAYDNTLVVVPKQDASKLMWQSYDCNHLLVNVTDFTSGEAATFTAPAKVLVDLPTLSLWIQTNVAPGTWVVPGEVATDPQAPPAAGVRVGTIRELETWGSLLIRQTPEVHAEIHNFLDTLEQTVNELMVVSLEISILTLDDATLRKIGVQWKGLNVAGDSFVNEGFVSDRSDLTSDFRFGAQPPLPLFGSLDTGPTAAIDYSIIRDWAARIVVELAEKIQGTEAVQAPRITLMQNQIGYIAVNDQLPYVSDLTTDVSEDAVGVTPTIAFLDIGVTFQALATISANRKYVYLTVAPTFTDSTESVTSEAIAVTGNTSSSVQQTVPIVTTTELRTSAKIPDGGTLVLGGLVRSTSINAESRVPILSHIPIVGNLFRSHGRGRDRVTIIVMITPHIVDYAEYEAHMDLYGTIAPSAMPASPRPVDSVATPQIGG